VFAAAAWYEVLLSPFVTLAALCLGAMLLWLARGKLPEFVRQLGIQKISAFGVDLQFAEQQTTAAYAKQGLDPPSEDDKAAIRDAVRFLAPLVAQTRILWVDDQPGGNALERSTFLSWEVDVQAARTTDEALCELRDRAQSFELVISDWRRPNDRDDAPAGLELLARMRELGVPQRVIFYHGPVTAAELATRRRQALDAGAVGTTSSPGELIRWTLIELSRVVLDSPSPTQRRHRDRLP
jgi:CheY-like chemotaxis protein